MQPFFVADPRGTHTQNLWSVRDVVDEINQFKLLMEVDSKSTSANNCNDPNKAANWRKYVREAVINCAGKPVELDFFEKIAGGKTEVIPTLEMYFKQNVDYDRNIVSKEDQTAAGPGEAVWFTLHRSNHSINGMQSYVTKGWELFLYDDLQFVRILDVNTDVPYAHQVKISPKNKLYTIQVKQGKKMLISPATQVGGYTQNDSHSGTQLTPGYIYKMTMLRLRVQWKQTINLMKGYKDQLVFGIMFDNEGKEIDCWEYYKKVKALEELKYAFNLQFFMGQKTDNPDVIAEMSDSDYPGFDGYVPTVMNAGGIVYPYDPQFGIDPYADFAAILMRQDSLKRHKEWTILRALPFQIQFDRNFSKVVKSEPGTLTYETFSKAGAVTAQDVTRMGVRSLALWNMSVHLKDFDALSDARSIGNGDLPYYGFGMPSSGLTDTNGRSVPPIEYFTNRGCGADGQYEEYQYDSRKEETGKEQIGGWMAKTVGMVTHCVSDHIIFKPRRRA